VRFLELPAGFLKLGVARSKQNCLPGTLGQAGEPLDGQVHTLLLVHAGDEHQEWDGGVGVQVKFMRERAFIGGALTELFSAKRRRQAWVVSGVPGIHIQAIHDAGDNLVPGLEQLFQSAAEFRGEDFLRVGFGDGGYPVGSLHSQREGKLFTPPGHPAVAAGRDAVVVESSFGARTHKRQVVHGKDSFRVRSGGRGFTAQAEQVHHQGGMPVVGVHDFRFPLQAVHKPERGNGKEDILAPVGGGVRAVDRAVRDGFAANQVNGYAAHLAVIDLRGEHASF